MDLDEARVYQRSWRFLIRALAVIGAGLGISILTGGVDRFDGTPSFAYAESFPGGHITWGVAATVVGAYTYASTFRWHRRCLLVGLFVETVIFAFFAITITVSATEDRTTPLTGIITYGGYAFMCALGYVAGHELRRARL